MQYLKLLLELVSLSCAVQVRLRCELLENRYTVLFEAGDKSRRPVKILSRLLHLSVGRRFAHRTLESQS